MQKDQLAKSLSIFYINSQATEATINRRLYGAPGIASIHNSQTNTSCNMPDM